MNLHAMSAAECVRLIHAEDAAAVVAAAAAGDATTRFVAAIEPGFASGGRLVYLGAGTSGRLGVLDASEAPPTFCIEPGRIIGLIAGGDSALRTSSEGKEDDPAGAIQSLAPLALTPRDAVLGIAAGGTTPYVLGALAWCKSLPAPPITGLLTCAPVPPPPGCDHLIVAATGQEVLTGSTRMKAGTATKLVLNAISTTLMVRTGRVHENLMVDLRATNGKLRDRAARLIATLTGLTRPESFDLLDRAGGSVKVAAVMHRRACSRDGAERLLAAAHGVLSRVL
jgi:N-acetylmuramic acid 6-phosphate etherase